MSTIFGVSFEVIFLISVVFMLLFLYALYFYTYWPRLFSKTCRFLENKRGGEASSFYPGLCHWAELCQPFRLQIRQFRKADGNSRFGNRYSGVGHDSLIMFSMFNKNNQCNS